MFTVGQTVKASIRIVATPDECHKSKMAPYTLARKGQKLVVKQIIDWHDQYKYFVTHTNATHDQTFPVEEHEILPLG